jgi:mRNA interferase MazF
MEEGQIILLQFPQDKEAKLRPALILREFPKYGDVLVCGITSRLHQYVEGLDIVLDNNHSDYALSGLKRPGVCRLNMLTMLSKEYISGSIGAISKNTHSKLLRNLANYLIEDLK